MTSASPASHCPPSARCTSSGSSTAPPGAARSGHRDPGAASLPHPTSSPFPVRVPLALSLPWPGPCPPPRIPCPGLSWALGTGSLCRSPWTRIGTRRWSHCVLACACWAGGPWGQPRTACLPGECHRSGPASCIPPAPSTNSSGPEAPRNHISPSFRVAPLCGQDTSQL